MKTTTKENAMKTTMETTDDILRGHDGDDLPEVVRVARRTLDDLAYAILSKQLETPRTDAAYPVLEAEVAALRLARNLLTRPGCISSGTALGDARRRIDALKK